MPTSAQWQSAIDFFIGTFSELAILFVVISFIVSVVNHYLPADKVRQLLSGNRGYGIAMMLGAVTPFCSCSTLPMMLGLLKARAAFGPLMAFLITSPLLNPFVIALFWLTFGAKVTLIYSFCVITIAGSAGALLQRFNYQRFIRAEILQTGNSNAESSAHKKQDSSKRFPATSNSVKSSCCSPVETKKVETVSCCTPTTLQAAVTNCCTPNASITLASPALPSSSCCDTKPAKTRADKALYAIFYKLAKDSITQLTSMLPYMIVGVAVGAALHGFVPIEVFNQLAELNTFFMIPLAALIGIFLYVRASTMIPIATSLLAKGLSMGSVMSLTIAGAGASLPEMIMLKKIFHWPLLIAFVLLVLTTACVTGISIELLA